MQGDKVYRDAELVINFKYAKEVEVKGVQKK